MSRAKGAKNKKGVSRILNSDGYYEVFKPEHPLAKRNGYVREHRMLAWDAGLLTDRSMEVHHKNNIKTDNRIENFEILTKVQHTSLTWKGVKRSEAGKPCKLCPTKTRSKYGLCAYHYRQAWGKKHANPDLLPTTGQGEG